jgi:hypothetical protein
MLEDDEPIHELCATTVQYGADIDDATFPANRVDTRPGGGGDPAIARRQLNSSGGLPVERAALRRCGDSKGDKYE